MRQTYIDSILVLWKGQTEIWDFIKGITNIQILRPFRALSVYRLYNVVWSNPWHISNWREHPESDSRKKMNPCYYGPEVWVFCLGVTNPINSLQQYFFFVGWWLCSGRLQSERHHHHLTDPQGAWCVFWKKPPSYRQVFRIIDSYVRNMNLNILTSSNWKWPALQWLFFQRMLWIT